VRPPRIPPIITDIIQIAVSSLDGLEFNQIVSCPYCGGIVQVHDRKKKKFAVLREHSAERVINVWVKRYYCRNCGNLCYANEPFYPGTRIGSPVIDIFSSLSATMPPSRAARIIDNLGIVVDRTTWKYYTGRALPEIPVVDVFGMRLPLSVVRLSDIAVQYGESDHADPADIISACGYPSRSKVTTPAPPGKLGVL
jgi:hypothetical protein